MTGAGGWLEEIWQEREGILYPKMFGPLRGIFPIPGQKFEQLGASADPRWLTIGVFESAPTPKRASWMYVTSGLSNPWEDETNPDDWTGYCCEFAMETAAQGDWAIVLLQHLAAIQLLALSGRRGEPVARGDRIGFRASIDGRESALRNVLITQPRGIEPTLQQRCGRADWLFCVGITDEERAFAGQHGNEDLLQLLARQGAFPVTSSVRTSLVG